MEKSREHFSLPLTEILKTIPELFGIRVNEEPHHDALKELGDIQIRRYAGYISAQLTLQGLGFDEFRETAFSRLAAYIFGKNESADRLAMTSPVFQQSGDAKSGHDAMSMIGPVFQKQGAADEWTMSFVLPAKYTLATAPTPNDPTIELVQVAPYYVAALRYSGNNSIEKVRVHEERLADWLAGHAEYRLIGDFSVAQYDAPFIIPFLKRNEIHAPIELR